jgi:aubergine-like protein
MIKIFGTKVNNPKYDPEIMYLTVNVKINSRFFSMLDKEAYQGNPAKFIPKVGNPISGSVILEEMSVNELYDFHLAAQRVTQGTCTPTQYIVVYDQSKLSQEAIAQFTFEQCYNYYNWTGAVKIPACLQCANKLSKMVGEHIK